MLTLINKEVSKTLIKGSIIDTLPDDLLKNFNNAYFLPDGFSYINGYDKDNKISIKLIGHWIKDNFYVKSIIFTKKGNK